MSRRRSPTAPNSSEGTTVVPWHRCEVINDGDIFFNRLEAAIESASTEVSLEFYIFAVDSTGLRFLEILKRAAVRGVRVRLVVDGIGASAFARQYREESVRAGIELRVFHTPPWERWLPRGEPSQEKRSTWRRMFRRLNKRNHRKLVVVDSRIAFIGSFNVTKYHLASEMGVAAWRDTGVIVEGEGVSALSATFEDVWGGRLGRLKRRLHRKRPVTSSLVRLNVTGRQRREAYLDLLVRLVGAKKRVWITNAYFVPDGSLLRVLSVVAREGVDVRILVPGFSDIVFIPWVTSAFHFGLLSAGVKIFEYRGSVLHAKTMVIDDWGLIGSSNLNHRSLLHDLEVDIVVSDSHALGEMERQFRQDLGRAVEVTLDTWEQRPFIERALGRVLLWFRYLM